MRTLPILLAVVSIILPVQALAQSARGVFEQMVGIEYRMGAGLAGDSSTKIRTIRISELQDGSIQIISDFQSDKPNTRLLDRRKIVFREKAWIFSEENKTTTYNFLNEDNDWVSISREYLADKDGKPIEIFSRDVYANMAIPGAYERASDGSDWFGDKNSSAGRQFGKLTNNLNGYFGATLQVRQASITPKITDDLTPTVAPSSSLPPTAPRIALLIGNSHYIGSQPQLKNPSNDVRLVASALEQTGFDVEIVLDASQMSMKRAISKFGSRISAAGKGATALFYYAGHGIQSRGINYLIPVGSNLSHESDVDLYAVSADAVLRQIEEGNAKTTIFILDACRDMPLAASSRSTTRGLARMDAPNGSFLAYSTAPGRAAVDGDGANSPFAAAIASEVVKIGMPIESVFRNVRNAVFKATNGDQTPWDSSSLFDTFVFRPGK